MNHLKPKAWKIRMGKDAIAVKLGAPQCLTTADTVSLDIPENCAAVALLAGTQVLIEILPLDSFMSQLNASSNRQDFFQGNYSIKPCLLVTPQELAKIQATTLAADVSALTFQDERDAAKQQTNCLVLQVEGLLSLRALKQKMDKPQNPPQQAPRDGSMFGKNDRDGNSGQDHSKQTFIQQIFQKLMPR